MSLVVFCNLQSAIVNQPRRSEVVGKPSRAPGEQGVRRRATGVYTRVHEDCEPPSNAVIPSAVGSSTASELASFKTNTP